MKNNGLRRLWNLYGHTMWFRLYLLGFAVICFLTVIKLPTAYYHREYYRSDFERGAGIYQKHFFKRSQYVDEELASQGQLVVTCPNVSLDKGDYRITVEYSADSEGSYIIFETEINPDEVEFEEYYLLPVQEELGVWELPVHLNGYTEGLNIHLYYGGQGKLEIFEMAVDGLDYKPGDILGIGMLVLFFYVTGLFFFIKKGKEKFVVFLALFSAAVCSSYPLFSRILYKGDDIKFHLMRVVGIRDGLLSGQFPVRLYPSANYGAGYDCSLYYPDIFLYIPAVLCLLGVSLAVSVQIFCFILHLLAVGIMYYSVRKIGGNTLAGVVGAVVYVFCEYFSCNFYYRFDLGECIAMCFFPLVICGFFAAVFYEEKEWRPLCIGMAGIVLSHVLSTLFAVGILVLFCLCFWRKVFRKDCILALCKAAVAAFGLCAWFLVPFLKVYGDRTNTNIINMVAEADNSALELGGAFLEVDRTDPRTLGMLLILGSVFCLYGLFSGSASLALLKKKQVLVLMGTGFGMTVCATSLFPWNAVMQSDAFHDVGGLLQFPWRFLGPASAFLALGIGLGAVEVWKKMPGKSLFAVVFSVSFILFIGTCDYSKEEYLRHGDAIPQTQVNSDYLYLNTDVEQLIDRKPKTSDAGSIELLEYKQSMNSVDMRVSAKSGSYVDTTRLYFLGYQAFDENGNTLPCDLGENNRLRILFPADYTGEVKAVYTGLSLWRVFDIVSILSLLVMAVSWIHHMMGEKTGKR